MSLLKLPLADTWTLQAGLEAISNAIRLAVGSGNWDGDSLDMTAVPSAPWTSSGGQFAGVIDGELLEINDASISDFRFFQLAPPDWIGDMVAGLTLYFKARTVINGASGAASILFIEDGSKSYQLKFLQDGTLSITAASTVNDDTAKYEWLDVYISITASTAAFYIFNSVTGVWDTIRTGLAAGTTASDRLLFGSGASTELGRAFWDRLFFKYSYHALPYITTAPEAEMAAAMSWGRKIDQIDLEEALGSSNANVKYQYAIDAGSTYNGTWLTLAQLQSALVGTTPPWLRLKAQFNSDGLTPASISLNGTQGVGSGYDDCDYPAESDVRAGVDYDSANLTGTAAIPAPGDVREGVAVDATVGTYKEVPEAKAELDFQYGADGVEFTGQLAALTASYELPQELIFEDEEIIIFEGCD
jgi:hypothetical protein